MNNDDDFDKFFGRIMKFGIAGAIITGIVYLGLAGVSIWAVIYVLTHIGGWIG